MDKKETWVSSRFHIIVEGGVQKRRCKHIDCSKEYSRGTSHQTLRKHWTKDHGTNDTELANPNYKNRGRSDDDNGHATNNHKSSNNSTPVLKKKKLSESNSQNKNRGSPYGLNSSSIDNKKFQSPEKVQLDVRQVSKRLKEAVSIHITFDIHTVKKGGTKSFGIITAHSMSENMELRSVLLEYKHLAFPDDTATILEFLRFCFIKFNIREKIVSITSNCSHEVCQAVNDLDKRFRLSKNFNFPTAHIKCFPQFLHLNVMEVFRAQEYLIDGVRKIIGHINQNNVILRPMMSENSSTKDDDGQNNTVIRITGGDSNAQTIDQSGDNRSSGLKLPFDNRNSWNTTYNMIDNLLQQRGVVEPTLLYFQTREDNIDWDKLFALKTFLEPFYGVVDHFVQNRGVPLGLVAVILPRLINHLSSTQWGYDDIAMAAHTFRSELETYQSSFQNEMTILATMLDPRLKDAHISPKDAAIDLLRKRAEGIPGYRKLENEGTEDPLWDFGRSFNVDEVTDYLSAPRELRTMSIHGFWSYQGRAYPALSHLAKMLCCIQATSVPCDRMFSAAEYLGETKEKKVQPDSTSRELMKSWAKYLGK